MEIMKYAEININQKLFGEENIVYDWSETASAILIYMKSKSRSGKCPVCGEMSDSYHGTYERKIQGTPIRMKTTYLYLKAHKYKCLNNDCRKKVFMEKLSFASTRSVRTFELESIILCVSIFLSNEGSSKVLGLMGIKVSDNTIKRIYDKMLIDPEENIEGVGIDDVAIRKGQSYATAIYDLKDRHLVALLEGRDSDTLKTWLRTHTKIKIVARDRASAYARAISEILPDCTQIADRFHLIANLIDRMREVLKEELPAELFIKNGEILENAPEKVKVLRIEPESKQLEKIDYDNSVPTDENGIPVSYDKGLHVNSTQYKTQAENRKKNRR
jgi:transposase